MAVITVAGLKKQAASYDPALRTLPYFQLRQVADLLRINIKEVKNEDVIVSRRRKANITGPYHAGGTINYNAELSKFRESALKPVLCYAAVKDNVTNYDDSDVTYMGGVKLDPAAKKHPLERQIIEDMVKSHAEDVVFSMFHADRDEAVNTPATAFNGFFTKIDMLRLSGDICAAAGNFRLSGSFEMPTSETDYTAYENLVEWIGGAHPLLKSSVGGAPILYAPESVLKAARAAYKLKTKAYGDPSMEQMVSALREDSMTPGLQVVTHEAIGTGSRLLLMKPNNLELGWNTQKAAQFVDVRDIFDDPNEVQFWLQAGYDTRVIDVHQKLFMTNEQTNSSLILSGDYIEVGAIKATLSGAAGKWRVVGKTSWKSSGQYDINLPAGEVEVEFQAVAGFTTPANQTVTVEEGKDTLVTATYVAS